VYSWWAAIICSWPQAVFSHGTMWPNIKAIFGSELLQKNSLWK